MSTLITDQIETESIDIMEDLIIHLWLSKTIDELHWYKKYFNKTLKKTIKHD